MFREIIEEVKNMNKEQETLQKEQADLKENRVSLPDMKNIITEIPKLLERLNSKLTSDVEGKCHLKSEEIQNIVETEAELLFVNVPNANKIIKILIGMKF